MMESKRKIKTALPTAKVEELRESMKKLKPQKEFAKTLLRLSRENLEKNPTVLDADEIMSELGRSRYE